MLRFQNSTNEIVSDVGKAREVRNTASLIVRRHEHMSSKGKEATASPMNV